MAERRRSYEENFSTFSREKAVQGLEEAMRQAGGQMPSQEQYEALRAQYQNEKGAWLPTSNQIAEAFGGRWPSKEDLET